MTCKKRNFLHHDWMHRHMHTQILKFVKYKFLKTRITLTTGVITLLLSILF